MICGDSAAAAVRRLPESIDSAQLKFLVENSTKHIFSVAFSVTFWITLEPLSRITRFGLEIIIVPTCHKVVTNFHLIII